MGKLRDGLQAMVALRNEADALLQARDCVQAHAKVPPLLLVLLLLLHLQTADRIPAGSRH